MKIRTGFVSNSSSSSFCFVGVYFGEGTPKIIKEILKMTNINNDNNSLDMDDILYECDKFLDKRIEKLSVNDKSIILKVEYGIESYINQLVLGASIRDLKDTETMGEFKNKISKQIEKIGIASLNEQKIGIHIDGGFVG